MVGQATVGIEPQSQAGYTLQSDTPIIVEDLRTETRFSGPPLLHDHGVVSGVSVIIPGQDQPYGVLGVHTTKQQTFTDDDANFLQAVSNVLATAIQRQRTEAKLRKNAERTELLLELHTNAPMLTDKELYDYVLEKAISLTESEIGFFHRISEDQEMIILTTWNRAVRKTCTAEYDSCYPIAQAGNWVDCVRLKKPVVYNDYPNSPNQKGLPEGHIPMERFMSIPVMEDEMVRFIFGVGNKPYEYDELDMAQMQLVTNELQKIMVQRRAEAELREQEKLMRTIAENYPNSYLSIIEKDLTVGFTSGQEFNKLGLEPESFVGLTLDDVFGEHAEVVKEYYLDTFQGKETSFELYINNQYQLYRTVPLADEHGEIPRILAVVENITERKQRDEKLRDQVEELQRWHNVTLGREDRVQELKHEVNDLLARLGEAIRYPSQESKG